MLHARQAAYNWTFNRLIRGTQFVPHQFFKYALSALINLHTQKGKVDKLGDSEADI